jgi:hypothetical protein
MIKYSPMRQHLSSTESSVRRQLVMPESPHQPPFQSWHGGAAGGSRVRDRVRVRPLLILEARAELSETSPGYWTRGFIMLHTAGQLPLVSDGCWNSMDRRTALACPPGSWQGLLRGTAARVALIGTVGLYARTGDELSPPNSADCPLLVKLVALHRPLVLGPKTSRQHQSFRPTRAPS